MVCPFAMAVPEVNQQKSTRLTTRSRGNSTALGASMPLNVCIVAPNAVLSP
jgi:hypothetical protein